MAIERLREGRGLKMKENVTKILWVLGIYVFIFFCFAPIAHAIDGSNLPDGQDPGNTGHLYVFPNHDKGVCDNCHIPHGAVGIKIWSPKEKNPFADGEGDTVRDLCDSCHKGDIDGFSSITTSGKQMGNNGNVFLETGADHVMKKSKSGCDHDVKYYPNSDKAIIPGTEVFPLDESEGFYCGTCHNPHKQPLDASGEPIENGDGDYLRTQDGEYVGTTHDRRLFCRQCHPKAETIEYPIAVHKDENPKCYDCHRVHDAYQYPEGVPDRCEKERDIFKEIVPDEPWFQSPPDTDTIEATYTYESKQCMGCHFSTEHWLDAPKMQRERIHHPMGRKWGTTSCSICHGATSASIEKIMFDGKPEDGGVPDRDKQVFSCISCHYNHTEVGNTNFLRYATFEADGSQVTDQTPSFCGFCHDERDNEEKLTTAFPKHAKGVDLLKKNNGKHFKTPEQAQALTIERHAYNYDTKTEEVVGCGGCMFCHFIHPNAEDDTRLTSPLTTDLLTLMRIPAVALTGWPQPGVIPTINRYEALCNGCHSNSEIVGDIGAIGGEGDSLLRPSVYFSHRFACDPNSTHTRNNTDFANGGFPKADSMPGAGPTSNSVMDDYGTEEGQIYCGTCHDVHDNSKVPYLYRKSWDDKASPYEAGGFCNQCHCTEENNDPGAGDAPPHPVGDDKGPNPPLTAGAWLSEFFGGGSGSNKGITADTTINPPISGGTDTGGVLCLTCHNIHAATTSWSGESQSGDETKDHGPILVMDNFQDPLNPVSKGSDMCKACHPDF